MKTIRRDTPFTQGAGYGLRSFRKGLLASALLFFLPTIASAATYYVSNAGSDANSGLSSAAPWKTLAKVGSSAFAPGDQILLRRGDTWREQLNIPSSGNSSARIVFSNYGTGTKPRILGSTQATVWTSAGTNIWKSNIVIPPSENVYTINSDLSVNTGVKKTSLSALTADRHWYREAAAIYLYSATNPATRYQSVEVPTRLAGITMNRKQYIEINGIDVFFTNCGIYESTSPGADLSGLIVRNGEFAYTGYPNELGVGIYATYSNSLFENNVIHDNGRRGISFIANTPGNPFTIRNIVVQNNTFYHGYHTTSVDLQTSNGVEGHYDNITIRGNLIQEDAKYTAPAYPMLLFLSDQSNVAASSVTNVFIYNNIFKYPPGPAIYPDRIKSAFIYNNTFYGHSEVTTAQSEFIFTAGSTLKVKNNIFYSQLAVDTNNRGLTYFLGSSADLSLIESDYNIFYRTSENLDIIHIGSPSGNYSWADGASIRSSSGWDLHSKYIDPRVVSSSNMSLQSTSPAINAGVNVGLTKDFYGNPIVGLPDIGAIESGSVTPSPTPSPTVSPTPSPTVSSKPSPTPSPTPTATVPGAPTSVRAVAGNASASISFVAPVNNGGSAITSYTVTSMPAGGVDTQAGTTSLTRTLTGLTNGTSYTFSVKATNAVGTSVASAPSNAVIPKKRKPRRG